MKKLLLLAAAITVAGLSQSRAQLSMGQPTAHPSAMLDITSNNRGVLIPRVTQANRPASPANGLLIYQTDGQAGFYYYDAAGTPAQWRWIPNQQYVDNALAGAGVFALNGVNAANTNTGNVGIGTGMTPPGGKLEVRSNSDLANPGIRVTESEPGDYARITLGTAGASNDWTIAGLNGTNPNTDVLNIYHPNAGDVVQINGHGNVGVGMAASPGTRLAVDGGTTNAVLAQTSGAYFPAIVAVSNSTTNQRAINATADGTGAISIQSNSTFGTAGAFTTGASGYPIIAIGGKSGFGTQAPLEMLDVNGGIRVGNSTGTNPGTIRFTGTNLQAYVGGAWVNLTGGAGAVNYWTASGNDISNNNAGNVGIGAAAAANSKLNVSSTGANTVSATNSNSLGNAISASATGTNGVAINAAANAAANIAVKASSTNGIAGSFSTANGAAIYADGGSTNGKGIIVVQGRTGLGVLAPTEQLDVAGAVHVGNTSNTNAGTIRYNGSDLQGYVGGQWRSLTDTGEQTLAIAGSQLSISGGNSVTLPAAPTYTAGTGITVAGTTISANAGTALWNANKLQGSDVAATAPTSGQVLTWDAATGKWAPTTPASGSGSGWGLTGNSGTNPGANYIGTSDNKDVVFKRNGTEALRLYPGGALVASGSLTMGTTPVSGAGVRMMFVPQKYAFRTGYVDGDFWDAANIGESSFAHGYNAKANGNETIAMGSLAWANGHQSIAIGQECQTNYNIGTVGGTAIGFHAKADGNYSTGIGFYSGAGGQFSTAIGYYAGAAGYGAATLGFGTQASGNWSGALGTNVSTNSHDGAYIIGDASTYVTGMIGQNDADHQMAMRFKGGYKLFTDQYMSIGAQMAANGNAWSTISDRRKKENLAQVDGELFLNRIAAMPLTSWNYKGQDARTLRHYGPMAQDFYAAFGQDAYGTVGNDTTINQADFDGVNLIAIQALEKRTRDLQSENTKLTQTNADLQKRLLELEASAAAQTGLMKRLEVLEAALGKSPESPVAGNEPKK